MIDGFKGRAISVLPAVFGNKDRYGNHARTYDEAVEISDVLIAPGDPTGDIEDGRPNGATVVFTLYMPTSIDVKWRGAKVVIDGEEFDVVGDPRPYPVSLVPTGRNLVVKVVRHEG